ncbi:cyclic nucleotide-binding domain-containing protein [Sulfurimonas sp.]|uniref:cyclic nucleotide-binding domain-containing protein n=1 Tax=Sulfurimonas sp. TaxID=2022749 RepID=UPI0025CFE53C|nr:cyclic nucleotide-binding domain-containing protein [Sulfurimonas sp.]MBT5934720.1 cyclic nucleotide-binding domain-containing protein [Sulfurimonas sp.]
MRLVTLNYNNSYLGVFFILAIISAFAINIVYTGKSWCNFFCPVGVVEKIYCISNSQNYSTNSACSPCTACKKNCPDIDMENNYWKESVDKQKSFVFYSFPGLVLGFYLYFYLQSGSYQYYFNGNWTKTDISIFSNGFFFAPFIPTIIAAPITLALFSFSSLFAFNTLEKYLGNKRKFKNATYETMLHKVKVIASYIAFNTFYAFAGAPTYLKYPDSYGLFYFVVVAISSVYMYREFYREQSFFVQERFALKILKKWDKSKPIPTNLKEIYYTYINETKNQKDRLNTYETTIRDLLQEGILHENSSMLLTKLREQIGVTENDHLKIMKKLKHEDEDLFDHSISQSTEMNRQKETYKKLLEDGLSHNFELDNELIKSMKFQLGISDKVHDIIMESIVNPHGKVHSQILVSLQDLYTLLKIKKSLYSDGSRQISFLKYTIKNEFHDTLDHLFYNLERIYSDHKKTLNTLKAIAKEDDIDAGFELNHEALAFMDNEIARKILLLKEDFDMSGQATSENNNKEIIIGLLSSEHDEIAKAALTALKFIDKSILVAISDNQFESNLSNEVYSLANKIVNNLNEITTYESMMYINSVPIFDNIYFRDLEKFSESAKLKEFSPNEYIIREGELGDTLYIIIKGKAIVEVASNQVTTMGDNDYFGEIAILGDSKRTASVKAIEPMSTLTISKEKVKEFISDQPVVSAKIMKEIIKKLIQNGS